MRALLLLLPVLLLSACDQEPRKSCIDGVLYYREGDHWVMKDAAMSHAGITPWPCKTTGEPQARRGSP